MIQCQTKVEPLALGVTFTDPLKVFLHYLSFCYYQMGETQAAGDASLSRLDLAPSDEDARQNHRYYLDTYGAIFNPRPDILDFMTRREQMRELVEFPATQS